MSAGQTLSLPFAKPTGEGLGKSGWVSLSFGADDVPRRHPAALDHGEPQTVMPSNKTVLW